ncbi:MAG: hypothetical protein ACW99G_19575 [Candidatus Thorarchaeota archaeon]|jgi:hypothetical protein
MIGLLIAAVIFCYYFVTGDESDPVLLSVLSALPFLWYWHWTWGIVKTLLVGCLGIVGACHMKKDPVTGGALVAFTPFLILIACITSALYLCGVYCVELGISSTGEIANERYLYVGFGLYGLGLFAQLVQKVSSSSGDSK